MKSSLFKCNKRLVLLSLLFYIKIMLLLPTQQLSVEAADEARIRLLTALFKDYDKNFGTILPPEAKGTEIQFGLMLAQADVDVEEETVTANIWQTMVTIILSVFS